MKKSYLWKLLLNHSNTAGNRLVFTNFGGRYLIDITMKPIVANQIISEVLKREWAKDDLMVYLDTMSGNSIDNDYDTCKA
ncbi:MAG: hypothetical protein H7X79_02455 [Sporomusaceae bacterium]|nr:hypothetical protein [Sporomusaceae bacterium]